MKKEFKNPEMKIMTVNVRENIATSAGEKTGNVQVRTTGNNYTSIEITYDLNNKIIGSSVDYYEGAKLSKGDLNKISLCK